MNIFSKLINSIKGLFGSSSPANALDGEMQTTMFGNEPLELTGKYETDEKKILTYMKFYPNSAIARYIYAQVLMEKNDVANARKQFMIGMKNEKEFQTTNLTTQEKTIKKKIKARIEKKLGYKLQ